MADSGQLPTHSEVETEFADDLHRAGFTVVASDVRRGWRSRLWVLHHVRETMSRRNVDGRASAQMVLAKWEPNA